MRKLLFGLLIATAGLVFFACSQKSGLVGTDALKTNANVLVALDSKVDNVVETSSYESDVFSLSSSSVNTYSVGLKSGDMMGGSGFKNMFEHFPMFKLHYKGGICPNLTVTSTNGTYPRTMTIDYGDSLSMANGHILKGKIIIVISAAPFDTSSTRTITYENFCIDSVCISGTSVKTRVKDPLRKFSEKTDITVTLADGTTIHRVDMTKVARMRERHKADFQTRYGMSLTFLPFVTRASKNARNSFSRAETVVANRTSSGTG